MNAETDLKLIVFYTFNLLTNDFAKGLFDNLLSKIIIFHLFTLIYNVQFLLKYNMDINLFYEYF